MLEYWSMGITEQGNSQGLSDIALVKINTVEPLPVPGLFQAFHQAQGLAVAFAVVVFHTQGQ